MSRLLGTYTSPITAAILDGDTDTIFAISVYGGIIFTPSTTIDLGSEKEIISMAKSPSSNDIFVSYPHPTNGLTISKINLDSKQEEIILDVPYINDKNENPKINLGGHLALVEDGLELLVALGDNDMGQQVPQDENVLWGKIISISLDNHQHEIHSVGLRNPKSLSRDMDTRSLYVVDDGFYHQKVEQVKRDSNYGWNIRKGEVFCFPVLDICKPNIFSVPKMQIDNTVGLWFGSGSPIGNNEFWMAMDGKLTVTPMKGSYWSGTKTLNFQNTVDIIVSGPSIIYVISGDKVYGINK